MKIPYGSCNFGKIRREGYFYVDKTPFLSVLENLHGDYVLFLRPRRFGKSTLLSTLEHYYDIQCADQFDELFRGLWVYDHPTPKKNKYLVLTLDFSTVASEGTSDEICRSFAGQIKSSVRLFVHRYKALIPTLDELMSSVKSDDKDAAGLMVKLFTIVEEAGREVYLLIDEYDHFGNRLLADGRESTYRELFGTTGFVRNFYGTLKSFTRLSLARMFITGVSPIVLDDLSSGFNILVHISQYDGVNAMAGFTRAEVEMGVDLLLKERPEIANDPRLGDREALLKILEHHYNGYRFSFRANQKMYNSTLVLNFLSQVRESGHFPREMLDINLRTDYGRLYAIARAASGKNDGTREALDDILTNESITGPLVERFGSRVPFGQAQIISLFYYLGMLTLAEDAASSPDPKLVIPNRVMRELQWEYLSFALADFDGISIDMTYIERALSKMALQGDIEPLIKVFHDQVVKRLSNRDTIQFDEKIMKLMLFAYLSQSQVFYLMSEKEFNQGYCDLLLGLRGHASASKFGWMLEAKYVRTDASQSEIDLAFEQAFKQLEKYINDKDLAAMLSHGQTTKAGAIVFVGFKDVQYRPWPKQLELFQQ